MAPSKAPAAQPGVRNSDHGVSHTGQPMHPYEEPVTVLLLGKRSTVRTLATSLPADKQTPQPQQEVVLEAHLGSAGRIRLAVVTSQRAALQQLRTLPPQAFLVEVDNRPHSRVRFCRMLRSRAPDMAILAVGDRRPSGPFTFDGFVSLPLTEQRTEAALDRLRDRSAPQVLACGPFELNVATRTVQTPSGPRHLTPKLCALLRLFMLRPNELVTRGAIMESIWDTSYLEDTRTLDVHVRWLRESIEADPSSPQYLLTKRGKGYALHCC